MESRSAKIRSQRNLSGFCTSLLILAVPLLVLIVLLHKPNHDELYNKMQDQLEKDMSFEKDLKDCIKQTGASKKEVSNFLRRMPLETYKGKCFVACILKKSDIIINDRIDEDNYMTVNREIFGKNNYIMDNLEIAMKDCLKVVSAIFEVCKYASFFNDCMSKKMHDILSKVKEEERILNGRSDALNGDKEKVNVGRDVL